MKDFDFNTLLKSLEKKSDYFEKKIYLTDEKFTFLEFKLTHPDFVDNNYLKCICLEEKRLDLKEELARKREKAIAENKSVNNKDTINLSTSASRFKSFEEIRKYCDEKISEQSDSIWGYFFYSQQDFFLLLNTISEYFFSGHIDPDFSMILKPRCKTRFCAAINAIYYRFGDGCLKYNNQFLSLLQKLSVFKKNSQTRIYNAVIKSPE